MASKLHAHRAATMSAKVHDVTKAAMRGDVEEIKTIVRRKIDSVDKNGRTPLMIAALHGQHKCLELLLGFGAQVDRPDAKGNTALHESCYNADIRTAQLLLDYKANISVKNKEGDTPLHLATYECNLEVVEVLLRNGGETTSKNFANQTPVQKLQSPQQSNNYSADRATKVTQLIEEWDDKDNIKQFKAPKSVKEETMAGIAQIEQNVQVMDKHILDLVEKVQKLAETVDTASHKLEAAEVRAQKFEKVVHQILEEVKIPAEVVTNSENVGKTLHTLMDMTSNIYENLCQMNEFNDRVFSRIFLKISAAIGKVPDLWKKLATNLYQGYPAGFVKDLLNAATANYPDDEKRTFECLWQWKIFVGTYVDKIEPLKNVIRGMNFDGKDALCADIDKVMDEYRDLAYDEPTGSLRDESLTDLGKQLGNKWKEVANHLDFTNAEIDHFEETLPLQEDKSSHMLHKWVERESGYNRAKFGRLCEALKRVGRLDLAASLTL